MDETEILQTPDKKRKPKRHRFREKNKLYIGCFCLPVLVLFAIHAGRGCFPFGERSVLVLDLNAQYVYYYEAFRKAFWEGHSLLYSWSQSLSGELFGIFAYYLASPFMLIYVLLPEAWLVPGVWLVTMLKAGTCALTFAVYVRRRYKTDPLQTLLLSAMYALSAYGMVNAMNPMWIDAMYMLPLIAMGIDALAEQKKIGRFFVCLTLAIFFNYYVGYMLCIFSLLYFLYRWFSAKQQEKFLPALLRFGAAGLLSVLATMVVLLPVYYSLQNGKLDFSDPNYTMELRFNFVELLPKLLLASYDSVNVDGLPMIYSGLLSLLLAPAFFLAPGIPIRKKAAMGGFLMVLFAILNISILDIAMHGFRIPNWLNYRYSFVFSFAVLLAAAEGLTHLSEVPRGQLIRTYGVLLAFIVLVQMQELEYLNNFTCIWLSIVFLGVYTILLCMARLPAKRETAMRAIAILCAAELTLNAALTVAAIHEEVYYSSYSSYADYMEQYRAVVEAAKQYNANTYGDSLYRMEKTHHRTVNDSMTLDMMGLTHSTSTLNAGALKLLKSLGYNQRDHWSRYTGNTVVADSLMGLRYILSEEPLADTYKAVQEAEGVTIYENPTDLGVLFVADAGYPEEELTVFNPFLYQNMMVRALTGDDTIQLFRAASHSTQLFGVHSSSASGYTLYTADTTDGSITYTVTPAIDGPLYMNLSTTYRETCNLSVNGEYKCDVLGNVTPVCCYLGTFSAGEEVTVSISPSESQVHIHTGDLFYSLNVAHWEDAYAKLSQSPVTVTAFSDTHIAGTVEVQQDEACIYTSIPYEKGWTVLVDGEPVEVQQGLNALVCFPVTAGSHTIEMTYRTPGLLIGGGVSVVAFAVFAGWVFLRRRKAHA